MDPLFIEQPEFEKVSRFVLDQDETKWTKQILDEFLTEFPFFMSQGIDGLEYKKKDASKGYAVATISAGDLSIPVVVNNYQLSPFDIVYKDGKTLPLTDATLGSLVGNSSAFKDVRHLTHEKSQVDMLFDRPLVDLQPSNNISKQASVIDRISDTITAEHKSELLEALSDPKIRAGFTSNGTVDVLAKIAKVIPKPESYFKDSLSKVLPRDIQYVEKVGRFNYKLTQGNSQVDDPVVTELTAKQAEEYDIMAVGNDIEKKAVFTSTTGAAYNVDGYNDKLVVMNVDGLRKHAYLNVSETPSEKCDSIFGGEMPELNDYGMWTDGNHATKPFEIVGMIKSAKHYEINAFDGMDATTYIPLRSVDKITPHEEYDHTMYIPTSYKFVKVGSHTDVELDPHKEEKVIANYYTRDDVNMYNLQGPVFEKYAQLGHNTTSLNIHEASWAALQCQASEHAITKMASAPANVRIPFESELQEPKSIDKVAELLQTEYAKHTMTVKSIAKNLIKEAAVMTDPQSVDAVLSLNMVTKVNILEFAYQLPLYEQVVSDLAKLLLTVRLGFSTVPEQAVVTAMKGLSQVVEILRGVAKLHKVK